MQGRDDPLGPQVGILKNLLKVPDFCDFLSACQRVVPGAPCCGSAPAVIAVCCFISDDYAGEFV